MQPQSTRLNNKKISETPTRIESRTMTFVIAIPEGEGFVLTAGLQRFQDFLAYLLLSNRIGDRL